MMKRTRVLISSVLALVVWSLGSYLLIFHFKWQDSSLSSNLSSSQKVASSRLDSSSLLRRLREAEKELEDQKQLTKKLQLQLKSYLDSNDVDNDMVNDDFQDDVEPSDNVEEVGGQLDRKEIIPILMFACNRPTISKAIDSILAIREDETKFPLIVSQDCEDSKTRSVIEGYGEALTLLNRPVYSSQSLNLTKKEKNLEGYYKISRHYKYALGQVFETLNYSQVIIVEDDLEFSPDFLLLFQATLPILRSDSSLFCVSAWNDNGKSGLIDPSRPELLYRTDFFPGLGWMMLRQLWTDELATKWPRAFWDDWLRDPLQRQQRSCVRPEISRSKTFGKVGVSHGLFFEKHLKFIELSQTKVDFGNLDLSYLVKDKYDSIMDEELNSSPVVSLSDLRRGKIDPNSASSVRLIYRNKTGFRTLARVLGIMDDFRSGVPRMAYKGVVSTMYKGIRVHVTPSYNWKGYDPSW